MGRPRDKETAKGLLERMEARRWADGKTITYRYHPVGGKPINLGTDKVAALRKVASLLGTPDDHGTMQWIWDRYSSDEKPAPRWKKLAPATKTDYGEAWKQIAKTFGAVSANRIDPPMVARYVHEERAAAPRRANIEKALLSNLFRYGITLGVCSANPTIGVELHESEARSEAPSETVLAGFLAWLAKQTPQRQIIGMAAEYASLAGSRKVEFLPLTWPQIDKAAGVIRTMRAKQRGKNREQIIDVVSISPAMATLLARLEAVRPNRECLHVFPTRDGNPYSDRGFKTLWQRCVLAAIRAGILTAANRFTFHDLRAFYTSKHKRDMGALPDLHKNPETTARIYDRNKEVGRRSL